MSSTGYVAANVEAPPIPQSYMRPHQYTASNAGGGNIRVSSLANAGAVILGAGGAR